MAHSCRDAVLDVQWLLLRGKSCFSFECDVSRVELMIAFVSSWEDALSEIEDPTERTTRNQNPFPTLGTPLRCEMMPLLEQVLAQEQVTDKERCTAKTTPSIPGKVVCLLSKTAMEK